MKYLYFFIFILLTSLVKANKIEIIPNQTTIRYEYNKETESKTTAAIADTYANLLYVNGKKDKAIKIEKEAIKLAKEMEMDTAGYEKALKKFQGK